MKAGVFVWVLFTAAWVGCVVCVSVSVVWERVWVLEVVAARPSWTDQQETTLTFFST